MFLNEWVKLRFGIYDEKTYTSDSLYPEVDVEKEVTSITQSLGLLHCNNITCDDKKHILPTKQNIICDGRTQTQVIQESQDYKQTRM